MTIPDVSGVPLLYVIREEPLPIPEGHDNFVDKCIACAPLIGAKFKAVTRQVYQLIIASVQGEQSKEWIKAKMKKQDGRIDFQCLLAHFEGEGNTSRRIAEAERLRDNLFYKSERAMPFATFLSKLQHMFNIYKEEEEEYSEAAKFRVLMEKIQHSLLESAKSALKVQQTLQADAVTFTAAANHMAAEVSKMPEFHATRRNVSFAGTVKGGTSIYGSDGKINTGFHKDWKSLSKEERDKVLAARASAGIKPGKQKNSGKRKTAATNAKSKIAGLQKDLDDTRRTVAALSNGAPNGDGAAKPEAPGDAGSLFGGRAEKAQKKN